MNPMFHPLIICSNHDCLQSSPLHPGQTPSASQPVEISSGFAHYPVQHYIFMDKVLILRVNTSPSLVKTLRTRSTTTRDRNPQTRATISTWILGAFFSGVLLGSSAFLRDLVAESPKNLEKAARIPGGEIARNPVTSLIVMGLSSVPRIMECFLQSS